MYRKGAVIMKNINLLEQNPLSFSQVPYYSNTGEHANYKTQLQTKMFLFKEIIQEAYSSIVNFFIEYLKSHKLSELQDEDFYVFEELLHEYQNFERKGSPILDEMLTELNTKEVDKENFDLLIRIIEHQESITKDILERDISIDRLEIIMNHLKDLPYYLRTDLEIETLPTLNQSMVVISCKSKDTSRLAVIKTDYNPFEKDIA